MHIFCSKFALVCDGIGLWCSHDLSNCCFTVKRASALYTVINFSQSTFIPSRGLEGEGRHPQDSQAIFSERGQEEDILSFAVCFERKHRETPIIFASRYHFGEEQEIFHMMLRSSLLGFCAGRQHTLVFFVFCVL